MTTLPAARTALVTGASSGIGRQLAVALGRAGLAVGLLGRDADRLSETESLLGSRVRTVVAAADVADFTATQCAADAVTAELGGVDLLVSAAGVIEPEQVPVWEADPAHWRRVLEVDLLGAFHAVRAVVPGMVARGGGRVVDLNSGAGTRDNDVYSAYYAAKTGLFRIGGALHAAGYDRGLRAFELAPGVVRTPMTEAMPVHDGRTEWTAPGEVADLVVAMAAGELDAWSGRMVRAGLDTVASLRARAEAGLPARARTLGVLPWGPDDPLG